MKNNLVLRWVLTIIAVILNALGVAFITTAALGTVPATSIPHVIALSFGGLSLGSYLFILSCLQILLQIILLRKAFHPVQILQLVPSVLLSYFVDFFMLILKDLNPSAYYQQILVLLLGTVILAFSIALEVKVDLVYLPLDGFNKALAEVSGKSFEFIKTLTDCVMVAVAVAITLIANHKLLGVREGTIIAAVIAGFIVKLFAQLLNRIAPDK